MVRKTRNEALLALMIGDSEAEIKAVVDFIDQSPHLVLCDKNERFRSVDRPDIVTVVDGQWSLLAQKRRLGIESQKACDFTTRSFANHPTTQQRAG